MINNGGIIGPKNSPTSSVASGVWSLFEQATAQKAGNWPPLVSSNNSVLFNGTTGYLKTGSSSDFAFGTGDFTMEAWIYPNSVSGTQGVVSTRIDAGGGDQQVFFGLDGTQLLVYPGVAGGTVSASVWSHIAVSRASGTQRIFLNGTQVGSIANTGNKTTTFGYVGAGGGDSSQLFSGYVSNARITKGVALYTGNFTVPTSPLTASANTSLLTCQAPNVFVDNSGKGQTVNQVGGVTAELLGPFSGVPTAVEYLVVAGGGGGGISYGGGGGGAGGYRTATGFAVSAGSAITVTVGAGGTAGNNGSNSVFSTITSTGGGRGSDNSATPGNGGSGGGGRDDGGSNPRPGGTGNTPSTSPSQGNNGGTGWSQGGAGSGGGGGGASQVGSNASSGTGAKGGDGTASSISGSSVTRAGGGGGDSEGATKGAGGAGGGGTGGASGGTVNTGGGAGGGSFSGGSGVVIIRYADTFAAAASTTGSPTVTVSGGYRIYQWTASGSITF